MKKIRNTSRFITLLINQLSMVILVLCISMVLFECFYHGHSITYILDDTNKTESFEETDSFSNLMESYIMNTIRFSVICEQFETNGEFDGKKEIDIEEYATHKNVSSLNNIRLTQNSSVIYYLEDLIKWGQIGYSVQDIMSSDYYSLRQSLNESYIESEGNILPNNTSTNSQTNQNSNVIDESVNWLLNNNNYVDYFSSNGNLDIIIEQPETKAANEEQQRTDTESNYSEPDDELDMNGQTDSTSTINADTYEVLSEEMFYPIDGSYLILHTYNPRQYAEYCQYLKKSINMAYYNFSEYRLSKEYLDNTNFKYYITYVKDGERYVYTNYLEGTVLGANSTEDDITQKFINNGKYIYCNYDNLTGVSNTQISQDNIWDEIGQYYYSYPGNTKMWFGIDTSYGSEDEFSISKADYVSNFKLLRRVFYTGCFFAIVVLITLVTLTINEQPENGRGTKLDKLKTEIAAVTGLILIAGVVCLFVAFFLFVGYQFVPDTLIALRFDSVAELTIAAVGTWLASILTLMFYLSLIRRLKSHTMLSNSLLHIIVKGMVYLCYHPKAFIRTWIPYLSFLLVNMIGIILCIKYSMLFIIVVIVFDIYAGYVMYRNNVMRLRVINGITEIENGNLDYHLDTDQMTGDNLVMANAVNMIGEGIKGAVMASMKDERLKADLITNVSHDIKTPLTSIISYIDLIKREKVENDNINGYIKILDAKSQRLKQLTDDLVEASKITSGNISLDMESINIGQMILQTEGEFDERFHDRELEVILNIPREPVYIQADARRILRVIENLYSNILKYAMVHTRVYIDLAVDEKVIITIKNISGQKLNINAKELTERFIRGDISRSTEGSGLGLSIARSLTELQGGRFDIYLDGDLFKVIMEFEIDKEEQSEYNTQ